MHAHCAYFASHMEVRMKRRRSGNTTRLATKALEMHALVPGVMTRRLSQLHGLSPLQAMFEWNRWAVEKSFAFSLSGLAFARGCTQAMLTNALSTERASVQSGMRALDHNVETATRMLAPLHRKVKGNAGRKRG